MTHAGTNTTLSAWFQRATHKLADIKGASTSSLLAKPDYKPSSISSPFNVKSSSMTVQQAAARAVAVFCGSSTGNQPAFLHAANSLGKAMAEAGRPLVYGGGSAGIMGAVSGAVLEAGGDVTGVVPYAMVAAGGEVSQTQENRRPPLMLKQKGREKIVVNSMHERKAEMARSSCGFVGLPGGYGTFEEVLEVVCWSQVGIHSKPVLVVNVLNFWNPLRELVRNGIENGFINARNEALLQFVEGPADLSEHESFDWGKATLEALDKWQGVQAGGFYDWTLRKEGKTEDDTLGAV
ncbi:hypothetical protein L227DRAFT_586761 [Lentinus tigrinus ALCF2SS1-6]|uniref:Lysine decarboxylase-like protein n=1 Tax=Lentinus tigrinus ALCF2SS1-6 TaxID=1328759 RepID=A0A5C2S647_9APHY|nr:hypothetical protein L227DRAFT_586761 [Lentinus tigrinus ALCF2SS1-6]